METILERRRLPSGAGDMPGRLNKKAGATLGRWTLVEYIDSGGNGDVWKAEASDGQTAALKILHRTSPTDYERFRREVEMCQRRDPGDVAILPVLDAHLPDRPTKEDRPWFAMPRATTLPTALAGAPLPEKVAAIRDLAHTLARLLAEEQINHRDVKPENLYVFDGRAVVGDFGLAKRPDDPNLTGDKRPGPFHHLPSEVYLSDKEPDWELVDVFCLANSMWRLAAEKPYPPRGQIRAGSEWDLARVLAEDNNLAHLARLIEGATADSPSARPTLREFTQQLGDWLEAREVLDDLDTEVERAERHRLAVLRWVIQRVRAERFPAFAYEISHVEDPSPIVGLSEGDVGEALEELIELGFIHGSVQRFGGGASLVSRIYPTDDGLSQVENIDVLTAQAAPLLRAFLTPAEALTITKSQKPTEIRDGLTLTPPEAYFQIILLKDQGLLSYRQEHESGGSVRLLDVRTTVRGKEWLRQSSDDSLA